MQISASRTPSTPAESDVSGGSNVRHRPSRNASHMDAGRSSPGQPNELAHRAAAPSRRWRAPTAARVQVLEHHESKLHTDRLGASSRGAVNAASWGRAQLRAALIRQASRPQARSLHRPSARRTQQLEVSKRAAIFTFGPPSSTTLHHHVRSTSTCGVTVMARSRFVLGFVASQEEKWGKCKYMLVYSLKEGLYICFEQAHTIQRCRLQASGGA